MPDEKKKIGRRESPQTLAALELMIALRGQGHGWRMIAAKLNAAGVPTTHGGQWRPGTVRAVMLRHRDRWE
jgi:hypothetical protein